MSVMGASSYEIVLHWVDQYYLVCVLPQLDLSQVAVGLLSKSNNVKEAIQLLNSILNNTPIVEPHGCTMSLGYGNQSFLAKQTLVDFHVGTVEIQNHKRTWRKQEATCKRQKPLACRSNLRRSRG